MRNLEHFVPPRDATAVIVVDIQERFFPAMEPERKDKALENILLVLQLAKTMGLPVLVTEQYPKGLGRTIRPVAEALPQGVEPIEKLVFSSWRADGLPERFRDAQARCAIVIGLESHVCVLATVIDMLAEGARSPIDQERTGNGVVL